MTKLQFIRTKTEIVYIGKQRTMSLNENDIIKSETINFTFSTISAKGRSSECVIKWRQKTSKIHFSGSVAPALTCVQPLQ